MVLSTMSEKVVALLVPYVRANGRTGMSTGSTLTPAESVYSAIHARFIAESSTVFSQALADFERQPGRHQERFRLLLTELLRRDPTFASQINKLMTATTPAVVPPARTQVFNAPVGQVTTIESAHTVNFAQAHLPVVNDAATAEPYLEPEIARLRDALLAHFSLDELRDLCLDLGVDPENLHTDTKPALARDLVLHCVYEGRLGVLVQRCRERRPHVTDWGIDEEALAATDAAPPDRPLSKSGGFGQWVEIIHADVVKNVRAVFSDVRQVIAFLGILIGVAALIASLVWLSQQPQTMSGEFNIAVAEFVQQATDAQSDIGPRVTRQLTTMLSQEYETGDLENVAVSSENMPPVTGPEEARDLAERVNAAVIIYGTAEVIGNDARVTPRFYVNDSFRSDVGEMNGEHGLDEALSFAVPDLINQEPPTEEIRQRAAILIDFTTALVYLSTNHLETARRAIETAKDRAETFDNLHGKEVLYLFASHIARLQGQEEHDDAVEYVNKALETNPNYGRAYIALGNIYYDRGNYYLAQREYTHALRLTDQDYRAFISEKANFGLGNIYLSQLLAVGDNPAPQSEGEVAELAETGLVYYQKVIDAYEREQERESPLRHMAAGAHANAGRIYQEVGEYQLAQEQFHAGLVLTPSPTIAAQIEVGLATVTADEDQ